MSAKEIVQKYIAENHVMVFSKSFCPYCKKAKALLSSLNVKYLAIELDNESNGAEIQAVLQEISGQRTVPNIYIGQQHIGGCDDLHAAHNSGKLKNLLKL
ncbi:thioredoxin reductase [Dinochytrium kinnereticum]|nr:thioredoxin reductase [Dinochytrium kinnereticum]